MTPEERIAQRRAELLAAGGKTVAAPAPAGEAPAADAIEKRRAALLAQGGRSVQEVGAGKAAALGAGQGATMGFLDEIAGGLAPAWEDIKAGRIGRVLARSSPLTYASIAKEQNPKDMALYRERRDEMRALDKAAAEQHPGAYYPASIAGSIATTPITGGGGLGLKGAAHAALLGGAAGLGHSEANTLRGLTGDAAVGAGLGGGLSGLASGVGGAASRILGGAKKKLANAASTAFQTAADETQEAVRSMTGRLGAEVQQGNRMVENVMRLLQDPSLDGAEREALDALRQTPGFAALVQRLAQSTRENLPGQAQAIDATRQAVQAAQQNMQPAIAQRAASILSPQEARRQVMERVKRYAPPLLGTVLGPGLGAGTAALIPGTDRGDIALGALAGAGVRPAAHALRRMARHPAVQTALMRPVAGAADFAQKAAAAAVAPTVLTAARGANAIATMPEVQALLAWLRLKSEQADEPAMVAAP